MRHRLAAQVLLLLAGAHTASAQHSRVTVSVLAGSQWNTPLFDYSAAYDSDGYQVRNLERLSVPGGTRAGARVSVRVAGLWLVYADVGHAGTHLKYLDEGRVTQPDGDEGHSRVEVRRPARVTTLGGGVGRSIALPRGTEMELTLGGTVQRFSLDRREEPCLAPSLGYPCEPADPWDGRYTVPSVSGALALRQPLTPKLGVELRGGYSVGRANTEGLYRDLVPALDAYEAPKRHTVRTSDVSLGVWVRP